MIVLSNIIVNIEFAFLCYSQFGREFIVHFDNHPAGGLILVSWVAVKNGKNLRVATRGECAKIFHFADSVLPGKWKTSLAMDGRNGMCFSFSY
jgi:hypothetical protein